MEHSGSYWMTPRLFVGNPPPLISDAVLVTCAEDAMKVMSKGGTAVLPPEAWDEASKVLAAFGQSTPQVKTAVKFAKTGKL